MQDLVLIGAPARLDGGSLGTVAVIAPTRIQYQEMIQAVRYIAGLSERLLAERILADRVRNPSGDWEGSADRGL
jgi:heat-inducible transcriptional repressor